jgi:hypothetical protein
MVIKAVRIHLIVGPNIAFLVEEEMQNTLW